MRLRGDRLDKVDRTTVRAQKWNFRTLEASLHHVSHRTTASESLRTVQQVRAEGGCEAWHLSASAAESRKRLGTSGRMRR